jgi:hypothetical protein
MIRRFARGVVVLLILAGVSRAAEPTILFRAERKSADDLRILRSRGLPVVFETRGSLLFEGTERDLSATAELGYRTTVLDRSPQSSDYLWIGLRPDSDRRWVESLGPVLFEEDNAVLVRVERGAPFAPLWGARVFGFRVPHVPMEPPVEQPATSRAETGAPADPLVQKIVDSVKNEDIQAFWQDITSNPPTGTRYSTHQGCRDAAAYCLNTYTSLGIPAEYQEWNPSHAPNVVATLEGAIHPERVYIVEGHLDDLPPTGPAPGADDNASGTVNVLESAKVMACWAFKNTVKFLNVTGEEFGLYGSDAYADEAYARGEDIRGVINMDMIGWEGDGIPVPENLDLDYNGPSQWLAERFADAASKYGTGLVVDPIYCPSLSASDHWPFWQKGWSALLGITDNEGYCGHGGNYPYYHTSNDTIPNCGDPSFFYSVVRTSVATLAELAEPFKIAFDRTAAPCAGALRVLVGDPDLDQDPGAPESVLVEVWSDTEATPETVRLFERDASDKIFEGTIGTTSSPPVPGDGLLSVGPTDTITGRYVDALDCDGATNVTYTTSIPADCVAPTISGVSETGITDTEATIVWSTDEPSDSRVLWGESVPPGQTARGTEETTSHEVRLTGLRPCTVYYYEVRSSDPAGNEARDDNGGRYFHFETLGDFGGGLQPCHEGRVTLGKSVVACSDSLPVELVDMDLNRSSSEIETVAVDLTTTTETVPERLTLVETGPNTSKFTGNIVLSSGEPLPGDGMLVVSDGDVVTVTYHDADDGTGHPAISFDTADADCAGPDLSVRVTDLTDTSAIVRWTSSEPTTGRVEWGNTPSLGNVVSDETLSTTHASTLSPLEECGRFYFRVVATDARGNTSVKDGAGSPYAFNAWTIPGALFRDDFESATGWTLEGEWQIGPPEGKGTPPPDPLAAFSGSKVLGHDLTGLGAHPGDYEPQRTESAISPVINASSLVQGQLKFRRWLNVGGGGISYVDVLKNQTWYTVWSYNSAFGPLQETAWSLQTIDISPYADGNRKLQIRFRQFGGTGSTANRSGWNVDRFVVKTGTTPDFDACGGCGGAPTFSGLESASDLDGCADSGVSLSWKEAPAWGTGRSGTYSVYRDTTPNFTPTASNRIATGLAATSYLDSAAPNGVTLYYLVRAENDETCSNGPNNGGVTDSNQVYLAARDEISQQAPGSVGDRLRLEPVNDVHVRLRWEPVPGAARYHVYRASLPGGPFTKIGEVTDTFYDDLGAITNGSDAYYSVKASDTCGNEEP